MIARTLKQLWAHPDVAAARDAFHAWLDALDAIAAARGTPLEQRKAAYEEALHQQQDLAHQLHGVLNAIDLAAGRPVSGTPEAREASAARRARAS